MSPRFGSQSVTSSTCLTMGGVREGRGEFKMDGFNACVISDGNGGDQKITWVWNKQGEIKLFKAKVMAECIP